MTVKDIRAVLSGNYQGVTKKLGVLLVDNGILRYKKLTYENYFYWWYETEDPKTASSKIFTYSWEDMELTRKSWRLAALLPLHNDSEPAFKVLNVLANLESASDVGLAEFKEIFGFYYPERKKKLSQLTIFEEAA